MIMKMITQYYDANNDYMVMKMMMMMMLKMMVITYKSYDSDGCLYTYMSPLLCTSPYILYKFHENAACAIIIYSTIATTGIPENT